MELNPEKFYLQACSIDELLSEDFETIAGDKSNSNLAALRLAAWCRQSANGNWELFNKRLERDNLNISQVLGRFASAKLKLNPKIPEWVSNGIKLVTHLKTTRINLKQDELEFPFFEIFKPIVDLGTSKLNITDQSRKYLTDEVFLDLQKLLYGQLSDLYTPYLFKDFQEFKKAGTNNENPKYFYTQFIRKYQEENLLELWALKPVFLRLTSEILSQWINCNNEFIERLCRDWQEIQAQLLTNNNSNDLLLSKIEGGISDLHNGGHTVYILCFSNKQKLMYKPKDCRLDSTWYELVNKLNSMNPPIDLKAAKICQKNGYGWSEFIQDPSCSDPKQFERFFFRAGALLALFHIFVGTDMHFENLIASNEYPVPIDLEMILQGTSPEHESASPLKKSLTLAAKRANNSVMNVGLLPTYIETSDKRITNIGGLNSAPGEQIRQIWNLLNTDQMFIEKKVFTRDSPKNIPNYQGSPANLADYLDHFLAGFSEYTQFIIKMRDQNGIGFFFDEFNELATRKVTKPTRFYHALIQRIKNPSQFDDGVIWSAEFDFVSRFSDWSKEIDLYWPLIKAERKDLSTLNIPVFFNHVKFQKVINPNGLVFESNLEPGLPRAISRLNNLTNEELQWQIQVIKASTFSYATYQKNLLQNETSISQEDTDWNALLNKEVKTIASTLIDLAITDEKGVSWIGIDWLGDSNIASRLVPLGPTLYGGNGGIALFLAAYGKHFQNSQASEYALLSFSGVHSDISDLNAQRFARNLGLGGLTGLGSIIYSLTVVGELLEEKELIDDAKMVAKLISKELILADQTLDIVGGSAGAILCLLKLFKYTQEDWILEKAVECGDHLLKIDRVLVNGKRSWPSNIASGNPLNGFSHGASGYAYALSYLSKITGLGRFQEAALECLEYENANYDEINHNWPPRVSESLDGPPLRDKLRTCQWCHGGIGVGLGRIALANHGLFDPTIIERDIQRAIQSSKLNAKNHSDSLCCGRMGNIEFLQEAGEYTKSPDLKSSSINNLMNCITTAHLHNSYNFNTGGGNGEFHLSLFRGIAGIGYTAMRKLNPRLPNVLILE
jgi:type 2 lantibiotic biosynthesis protein LanM